MGFVEHPVAGIAILLWSAEPEAPHRLGTPFFYAAAAAAMELRVEIYFTARSVRLLVPGVADALRASPHHPKTILDAMREAVQHGARLFACSDALDANGIDRAQTLIPECSGHGGAVQFMGRAADVHWRTLVF
ncbi:MAG TPA: DsrE family protein [Burkholderiaceae bacterium]|nr:DsrE family protein [Burkholderiaceae bacterium]